MALTQAAQGKQFMVIEALHAGVGSVFDLSNARGHLRSGVVLVSGGGIGRPVERSCQPGAFIRECPHWGDHNRALPEKLERVRDYVQRSRSGRRFAGRDPAPAPFSPTVRQVLPN